MCKDVPSPVGPVKIHISMCKAESLLSIFIEALDLWLFTDRPVNTDQTALMLRATCSEVMTHKTHGPCNAKTSLRACADSRHIV